MSHASGCFRSDGDWFCAAGCTHDEEERAAERTKAACDRRERETVSRIVAFVLEIPTTYRRAICAEIEQHFAATGVPATSEGEPAFDAWARQRASEFPCQNEDEPILLALLRKAYERGRRER